MAYKSAKKSAALSLKFLFWFLNLKVCYVSVIIVLVTHANLLVALPQKTILDMQQFCWRTSKLIEMGTQTMHAGSHREDKNQWGVKIKTHLNLHEKTAGWRIQLQMTSCVVTPIRDIIICMIKKCNEKIKLKSKPLFTLKSRRNLIKGQNVPKLFSSLIWEVVEGWKGTRECYFSLDCKHGQNKLEKLQSGTKVVKILV